MHGLYTLGALVALTPRVHALFETTYHSSSLAIQPFTILERSAAYDPTNIKLFLVCPSGIDIAQPGPTIYKSTGELVWSDPGLGNCNDLNYQTYDGQQYLTVWIGSGSATAGGQEGSGKVVMLNSKYEVADLTSVGGPADGFYANSIIQEIDIATGNVLFNWTSIDHIAFDESSNNISLTGEGTSATNPWDAVHINSIDKDSDGNYLISSRNCQTIYKIDKNGTIIWRLGGKFSDFTPVGDGDTQFHWQHHARWRQDDTQISVFDDGASVLGRSILVNEPVATGKYLNIDQDAMTVSLAKRYFPAPRKSTHLRTITSRIDFVSNLSVSNFSLAEGSIEPYGPNVLVSYGSNPWVMEYGMDNETLMFSAIVGPNNASLWLGAINNYRAFQTTTLNFTGHPTQPPNVSVTGEDVYVSWNGATHVAAYTLLTGSAVNAVSENVTTVAKSGFETKMSASGSSAFIAVAALAANGTTLGTSAVYKTSDGSVASR
ncbi:ASST-domain-containing protein [Mycena epipterygia]|nr:ASST-domain-containing protein [Mycena epipterygia]